MIDDSALRNIPDPTNEDEEMLLLLVASALEYEALLLRVGRTAAPAARLFAALRGRQH